MICGIIKGMNVMKTKYNVLIVIAVVLMAAVFVLAAGGACGASSRNYGGIR